MTATAQVPAEEARRADVIRRTVSRALALDPARIDGSANLVLLGLDSLAAMRLAGQWRREGIRVDFAAMIATPTLDAWIAQARTIEERQ
jgi:mycobactin phenyloxazoline synthetase